MMSKKIIIIGIAVVLAAIAALLVYQFIARGASGKGIPGIVMDEQAILTANGAKAFREGDLLKAKEIYKRVVEKFSNPESIAKIQETLDRVNIAILFSPVVTQDSSVYEVKIGDTLNKIAKKYNTTAELISKANNLKGSVIRLGQRLKVSMAHFGMVVDKSQNILTLKADGEIVKTYRVSTGKNSSTPVGSFKIINKIVDPVWYTEGAVVPPDSPKNILGSRWMGISTPGYGIHGTTEPESIGKSVTAGCVRMKDAEVEELYSIVPEGTEVVIVD